MREINVLKEIWKWVLNQQEDQQISEIVNTVQVVIPGFRRGSKLPPKHIMIMQLLKPKYIQRMANSSISLSGELDEAYDFLNMSDKELESIKNIPPSLILLKLLSGKEEDKAITLFDCWKREHGEEGLQKMEEERKTVMETWLTSVKKDNEKKESFKEELEASSKEGGKWEKIQKKLERKLKILQDDFEQLQSEYKAYQDEKKEKEKEEKKEYQLLKTEYNQLQQEYKSEKLSYHVAKENWEKEKVALLLQIETIQNEKIQCYSNLLNQENKLENEKDRKTMRKIYLLGNPHNSSIFLNCPFDVKIVERKELDKVDFTDSHEIWGLTYKLDPQLLKNVQRQTNISIKKIETFQQLKQEIEKGREEYAKQKVGS